MAQYLIVREEFNKAEEKMGIYIRQGGKPLSLACDQEGKTLILMELPVEKS